LVAPESIPRSIYPWLVAALAVGLLALSIVRDPQPAESFSGKSGLSPVAAVEGRSDIPTPRRRFATTIRRPDGPPVIELQTPDPQGRVGSVACSTCHSVRDPNFANRTPGDLDEFHQNMKLAHGTITCYACHHPDDMDSLRLADGTSVEYRDVMTLCGQCHGSQLTDYKHGAHGGMSGYWDLSRGPRLRNNCIDCHDPHVPQFPSMTPSFKPRDRFLDPVGEHGEHSEVSHE